MLFVLRALEGTPGFGLMKWASGGRLWILERSEIREMLEAPCGGIGVDGSELIGSLDEECWRWKHKMG